MNKESVKKWSKDHRKQIVVAGITTVSLIGLFIGLKDRNVIEGVRKSILVCNSKLNSDMAMTGNLRNTDYEECYKCLSTSIAGYSDNGAASKTLHEVTGHVRNLHEGWCPSQEKIDLAKTLGIELLENQTFVQPYTKGKKAA